MSTPLFKDLEKALAYAKKAVELSERKDVIMLNTLAVLYQKNDLVEEAIALNHEVLDAHPGNKGAKKRLKELEEKLKSRNGEEAPAPPP